mmetsp:Transcript_27413/g.72356  ORF Transcript_27413/g.72356 Transcript_27413/m.72356 type:complete len:222 (-) Transcript_27413:2-667(-)
MARDFTFLNIKWIGTNILFFKSPWSRCSHCRLSAFDPCGCVDASIIARSSHHHSHREERQVHMLSGRIWFHYGPMLAKVTTLLHCNCYTCREPWLTPHCELELGFTACERDPEPVEDSCRNATSSPLTAEAHGPLKSILRTPLLNPTAIDAGTDPSVKKKSSASCRVRRTLSAEKFPLLIPTAANGDAGWLTNLATLSVKLVERKTLTKPARRLHTWLRGM